MMSGKFMKAAGLCSALACSTAASGPVTRALQWDDPNNPWVCGTRVDAYLVYPGSDPVGITERVALRQFNKRSSTYRVAGSALPTRTTMTVDVNESKGDWSILYIAHFLTPRKDMGFNPTNPVAACEAARTYVGSGTNPYDFTTRDIEGISGPEEGNSHFICTSRFLQQTCKNQDGSNGPDDDGDGLCNAAEGVLGSSSKNPNSDGFGSNDGRQYCGWAVGYPLVETWRNADNKGVVKTKDFNLDGTPDAKQIEDAFNDRGPFPF